MNPAQSKSKFNVQQMMMYMSFMKMFGGNSKPVAKFSTRKWNRWFKNSVKRNKIPTRIKQRDLSWIHYKAWQNQVYLNSQFLIVKRVK